MTISNNRDEDSGPDGIVARYKQWPANIDGTIEEGGDGVTPTFRSLNTEERTAWLNNEASDVLRSKATAVDNAVAALRQWAIDADGTTVTSGNAVVVLQQVVDRLGVFFDRFADLVESKL